MKKTKKLVKSIALDEELWERLEAYDKANGFGNVSRVLGYVVLKWFQTQDDASEIVWRIFHKTPRQLYDDTSRCGCTKEK